MWKRSHIPNPDIPSLTNHGWILADGLLQPHWFNGNELPNQLEDIEARNEEHDSGDDETDTESDAESDAESDMVGIFFDSDDE